MILADRHCPSCGHTEQVPFNGVVKGDAGIWCRESCIQAFRIRIDFQAVPDEQISRALVDGEHGGVSRPHKDQFLLDLSKSGSKRTGSSQNCRIFYTVSLRLRCATLTEVVTRSA